MKKFVFSLLALAGIIPMAFLLGGCDRNGDNDLPQLTFRHTQDISYLPNEAWRISWIDDTTIVEFRAVNLIRFAPRSEWEIITQSEFDELAWTSTDIWRNHITQAILFSTGEKADWMIKDSYSYVGFGHEHSNLYKVRIESFERLAPRITIDGSEIVFTTYEVSNLGVVSTTEHRKALFETSQSWTGSQYGYFRVNYTNNIMTSITTSNWTITNFIFY